MKQREGSQGTLVVLLTLAFFALGTCDPVEYPYHPSPQQHHNVCSKRGPGRPLCPELFILGVQRSGSSGLWEWMQYNYPQQIGVAERLSSYRRREPHFFDLNFERGMEYYASLFPVDDGTRVTSIDGTPSYSQSPAVAERIQQFMPAERLRFILSFRDPVARAYSWYGHVLARIFFSRNDTFGTAPYLPFNNSFVHMAEFSAPILLECTRQYPEVDVHRECASTHERFILGEWGTVNSTGEPVTSLVHVGRLFADGLYGYILKHWLQFFEPEQFCVVFFEHLTTNFREEMEHVRPCLEHVGLPPFDLPTDVRIRGSNDRDCRFCASVDLELLARTEQMLQQTLFRRSNQLLRELVLNVTGRSDVPRWADDEDDESRA